MFIEVKIFYLKISLCARTQCIVYGVLALYMVLVWSHSQIWTMSDSLRAKLVVKPVYYWVWPQIQIKIMCPLSTSPVTDTSGLYDICLLIKPLCELIYFLSLTRYWKWLTVFKAAFRDWSNSTKDRAFVLHMSHLGTIPSIL